MADLNALIAQGAQFRIPPPVDPMGNMPQLMQMRASQNQNALAQYQLSSAKRKDASTNALNTAYQNAYDPATGKIDSARLLQSLASSGAGSEIPGVQKSLTDAEIAQLQRQELQGKVNALPGAAAYTAAQTTKVTAEATELASKTKRDELKRAISDISKFDSAADALQNLAIHERDGKISPEKAAQMRAVLSDPNLSFSKWQRSTVMGLMDEKDRVEATRPKPVATQLGNRVVYLDMNPDSPTFKQEILPSQTMGAAPSTAAALQSAAAATSNAATSAGQLGVAKDRLAQEGRGVTYIQDAAGGFTAVPNRLAPGVAPVSRPVLTAEGVPLKAKLTPFAEKQAAAKVQLQKDLTFAITEIGNAIKEGGLIDQSTGSGAGRLVDIGAGFVGQATPGAIAIGNLQPIADLPLKLVTRFEGPQSDKDTKTYKEASGQLANPTLPRKIRKAAGATVVRIMKERQGQFATNDMAPTVENAAKADPNAEAAAFLKSLGVN